MQRLDFGVHDQFVKPSKLVQVLLVERGFKDPILGASEDTLEVRLLTSSVCNSCLCCLSLLSCDQLRRAKKEQLLSLAA